ncbi:hypothetical protein DFH08DRAFT_484609 [Mycena albidolilacea]|uniref:Uncharacterized protein n=1 Tax=Mycena albidolilacea TaxID=1033008 RepID=A0AAD6Z6G8_9AGAR|nr:hypothetical protein DFH08DRAFT_484609 [Mycena albidolilacea]
MRMRSVERVLAPTPALRHVALPRVVRSSGWEWRKQQVSGVLVAEEEAEAGAQQPTPRGRAGRTRLPGRGIGLGRAGGRGPRAAYRHRARTRVRRPRAARLSAGAPAAAIASPTPTRRDQRTKTTRPSYAPCPAHTEPRAEIDERHRVGGVKTVTNEEGGRRVEKVGKRPAKLQRRTTPRWIDLSLSSASAHPRPCPPSGQPHIEKASSPPPARGSPQLTLNL